MGTVFVARRTSDGTTGAVKVLASHLRDRDGFARFVTEARALARVRHSNVVRWLDDGLGEDVPFYVMEHVGRATLADLLDRPPGNVRRAVAIASAICDGVAAIHAAEIVHRDLKPSNVLMRTNGRVVVADFGLAMPCASVCRIVSGEVVGTPAYIAPEVIAGACVSPARAIDVYAVGVIAYELLTGHLPFLAEESGDLMLEGLLGDRPVASSLRPELPRAFDGVLATALARDPHDRFASIEELGRALRWALPT
jgi:serine/threonine-protein kinase